MRAIALALTFLAASAASVAALTPGELNPLEQALYATLKSDPFAARSFLATREYVRQAEATIKSPASAASFPDQPNEFDVRYLFIGDKDAINEAVSLSVTAIAKKLWT